jgi:hypothetical protein
MRRLSPPRLLLVLMANSDVMRLMLMRCRNLRKESRSGRLRRREVVDLSEMGDRLRWWFGYRE